MSLYTHLENAQRCEYLSKLHNDIQETCLNHNALTTLDEEFVMICFKRVIIKIYGVGNIEIRDSLDNTDLIFKYSGLRGGNLLDLGVT